MSPTRLVEQRTLDAISISLGRLEEPRELGVCLEEAIRGQHHHNSHRHGQDWKMNPLGPTFRPETQEDPTVPPVPEEEGEVTAEPEDNSTELLRRMLARDASQTFRRSNLRECQLRQYLEVCHHPELVKKVLGQRADLSRHEAADRPLATTRCYRTSLARTCRQAARS